jgi:glycosyltransferase involved in cell wall biosynthesis
VKKKLLHLQLLPILSGVQRFSLHLLDGLDPEEYDIYVASKAGGELQKEVISRGWHYLPIYCLKHPISLLDVAAFIEILYTICRYRFHIVHTNSSKPGLLGRLAARIARVPRIIHTVHGTPFQNHQPPGVQRVFMELEKLGNHFGDVTVFVNHSDRKRCLELNLLPSRKAVTIYNAMDPVCLPRLNPKKPTAVITIGSTIRFSDQKNVVSMITAACKACHRLKGLRFIFLGDGQHYELCRSIVASHRLSERILLPGWDSEVEPWLKVFDLFILYSRWEAMPFSIIEAMRFSLPVIGSDIPSIRELVNTDNGWLVPLDDDEALLEVFQEVVSQPARIAEKGKNAYHWINRISNYNSMIEAYRDVYDNQP